ncbi:hypothetical protein C8T65DRAFT_700733 [Cerioporus squamosus]|nr:hypothetical protein C8T65DRAFT_700733 [Cerioporus squamosus]
MWSYWNNVLASSVPSTDQYSQHEYVLDSETLESIGLNPTAWQVDQVTGMPIIPSVDFSDGNNANIVVPYEQQYVPANALWSHDHGTATQGMAVAAFPEFDLEASASALDVSSTDIPPGLTMEMLWRAFIVQRHEMRIQNRKIERMSQQLATTSSASVSKKLPKLETKTHGAIQRQMREMIGCTKKIRRSNDRKEPVYWGLCAAARSEIEHASGTGGASAEATGQEATAGEDSELREQRVQAAPTKPWYLKPNWEGAVNDPVNEKVIKAVVDQLYVTQLNGFDATRYPCEAVSKGAQTYFGTLKTQMRHQDTSTGRAANRKKIQADERRDRKKDEADEMRIASIPVRKYLGHEGTQGLCEVIQSTWEDSLWSSEGEEHPEERAMFREVAAVSEGNWERYPRAWHSYQLRRIYAGLEGIHNALRLPTAKKSKAAGGDDDDEDTEGEDDGLDYTEDQRDTFMKLVHRDINQRPRCQHVYRRFRGRSHGSPPITRNNATIYKELISEEWAARSPANMKVYVDAPHCPVDFAIMFTPIPDDFIPLEVRTTLWPSQAGTSY